MRSRKRRAGNDFDRFRSLNPERKRLVRDVLERDVVRNNVALNMLEDASPGYRFRVEQEMILETKDVAIGEYAALCIQEKRVEAVAGFHFLHMIGRHGMQQTRPVFTRNPDPAAVRYIDQTCSVPECVVAGSHTLDSHLNTADKITIAAPLIRIPVSCRDRLGLLGRTSRIAVAKTCRANRTLMPKMAW